METVEKTTGAIAQSVLTEQAEVEQPERPADGHPQRSRPVAEGAATNDGRDGGGDPWASLLRTGLSLLEELSKAARSPAGPRGVAGGLSIVQRDPETGRDFLRIPMPPPDVLDQALGAIGTLMERFRAR
jgi:hypothetical protein